jgi:hypothetical protein
MLVRYGSSGADVSWVQEQLKAAGLSPGVVDGCFGARTRAAVIAYQERFGLVADGVVGERTRAQLENDGFDVGGVRPTDPVPSNATQVMLDEAVKHLGYREGAGNSNKFSTAMGRPAEAWCADFVSFLARKAGLSLNTASAEQVHLKLAAKGTWKGRTDPQPGDAVTFRWDGSRGWADHVGIVEKVFQQNGRTYIQTIEGNSADMVRRKVYPANDPAINGFGRIV